MVNVIIEDGGQRQHRRRFQELIGGTKGAVRIASAYVTERDLLCSIDGHATFLLTALSPMDVASGATSIESLRAMIEAGVKVRVLPERPRLHAKVYIFGKTAAVVTSANLTLNALDSNLEVGAQVAASDVEEILKWYQRLWHVAKPLNLDELADLKRRAEPLRRQYAKLKAHANERLRIVDEDETSKKLIDHTVQLCEAADQFFLCNTDRKVRRKTETGGYLLEEEMHTRGYAAVWEKFHFPNHMDRVQVGDIILMYAKGVGIIGVGRSIGELEKIAAGDRDRLRVDDYNEKEWRIPVEWLAWWDEFNAVPYKATNNSFLDVSGDSYRSLREDVMERLRSE